jgi:hypothetical protein
MIYGEENLESPDFYMTLKNTEMVWLFRGDSG